MNIILIILLIIGCIIAVLLVAAITSSDDYTITREIVIEKPKEEVFNYISILRNSDNYNKWVMLDPSMKKIYSGVDGTVGFIYSWESDNNQVGQGEQEITGIVPGERIDYELRFLKPFESKSNSWIITTAVSTNQTNVKWVFYGLRTFPMKVMHILLNIKKMLGNDLKTSLVSLKTVLEK